MLCAEFEERLTEYLDGALAPETGRAFAEHALRCPVCHELLNEVKSSILACRTAVAPTPPAELEARVLLKTAPETAMTCEEFEEYLTDYLDGFLPAPLYHRWERHAALCNCCTELPGEVVRAIGACYSYISEERPVPAGLQERILQATIGTTEAEQVRAPLGARIEAWLRYWLDAIVSPQLATVATMVLVAVLVGTSTISDDGTIGGMYRASLKFAAQAPLGASSAARSTALTEELKRIAAGLENLVGAPSQEDNSKKSEQPQASPHSPAGNSEQKDR